MSVRRGVTLKGLYTFAVIAGLYAWVYLPSAWLPAWLGPIVLTEVSIAAYKFMLAFRRQRREDEARWRAERSARIAQGRDSRRNEERGSRTLTRRRGRSLRPGAERTHGAPLVLYRSQPGPDPAGLRRLRVRVECPWHYFFPPSLHVPRTGAFILPVKRPADWN